MIPLRCSRKIMSNAGERLGTIENTKEDFFYKGIRTSAEVTLLPFSIKTGYIVNYRNTLIVQRK